MALLADVNQHSQGSAQLLRGLCKIKVQMPAQQGHLGLRVQRRAVRSQDPRSGRDLQAMDVVIMDETTVFLGWRAGHGRTK